MNNKNNRGFILSTYVYVLLVFFLLLLSTMIVVLNNTTLLSDRTKNNTIQKTGINSDDFSIILNGDKNVYINLGDEYKDMGYIAQTVSGTLLEASITSDLDTSIAGNYSITYTVRFNGKTKSVTRYIFVLDNIS